MSDTRRKTDGKQFTLPNAEMMTQAGAADGTSARLADGSIWSHAAEMGTFTRGGSVIDLTAATLQNIVANFSTGYPTKVPVDYDHGSTNGTSDGSKPVPKAGDVLEMRAVVSADQLPAEALPVIQADGRTADDPRNLGLWVRWRPTARALSLIQAREYTEMSITLFSSYQSKSSGDDQGATIVAIALTNLPYLDGMLPVAASRGDNHHHNTETEPMSANRLMVALAVLSGTPVVTEDEAQAAIEKKVTELRAEAAEVGPLRDFRTAVQTELGAKDAAGALSAIAQLKAASKSAGETAEQAKETALTARVDTIIAKHEKKLTPLSKKVFAHQLKAELQAGAKDGETETEKALASMPDGPGAGDRKSGGDSGDTQAGTMDDRMAARAEAIVDEDPKLKAMEDRSAALSLAIPRAAKELGYKAPQRG